jgi:Zn-dependent protease with chaperone function
MRFVLYGTTLTLAWFLAVNAAVSALVLLMARRQPRADASAFWFGLRVLPALAAAAFAALVFVPSYWRYEPREAVEAFSITLAACALLGLAILAAGMARGTAAWWRANRRTRLWMQASTPIPLGCGVPAFAVDAELPIMALVGVWRPRLLVTRGLLDALTPEELAAAVAHELGHSRARDNFKRLAMRAAPDLLASSAAARTVEQRWASAAEHDADRRAGDGSAVRCALASALVKVARLTPPDTRVAEPISTLIGCSDIPSRVHALVSDRVSAPPAGRRRVSSWLCATAVLAPLVVSYGPLLHAVHELTEILVSTLP